jgi:hypothetical protein
MAMRLAAAAIDAPPAIALPHGERRTLKTSLCPNGMDEPQC